MNEWQRKIKVINHLGGKSKAQLLKICAESTSIPNYINDLVKLFVYDTKLTYSIKILRDVHKFKGFKTWLS